MNSSSNKFHLCHGGWLGHPSRQATHLGSTGLEGFTRSSPSFRKGNTSVEQGCFSAAEFLWVLPLPARTFVLTCSFLFQSTRSSMKPALELSGISCVGSAVNMIRLNVSAPERRKSWVILSLAAGMRTTSVTPA